MTQNIQQTINQCNQMDLTLNEFTERVRLELKQSNKFGDNLSDNENLSFGNVNPMFSDILGSLKRHKKI
jgi:hypothetical protein